RTVIAFYGMTGTLGSVMADRQAPVRFNCPVQWHIYGFEVLDSAAGTSRLNDFCPDLLTLGLTAY
ncbi:hypothetical protein ACFQ2K_52860, partial [Streptomyces sanglieri]